MTPRTLALLMVAACLLLLGATAADWAVVEADRTIDTAQADVVVERTETTSGAEVAGGLFAVGLSGLVIAGLSARWPLVGAGQVLLGGVAAVAAIAQLRALDGVTSAPSIALAAGVALIGAGLASILVARRGGASHPARAAEPSRYTVEAVREGTPTGDDEWDVAVADDAAPDAGGEGPGAGR